MTLQILSRISNICKRAWNNPVWASVIGAILFTALTYVVTGFSWASLVLRAAMLANVLVVVASILGVSELGLIYLYFHKVPTKTLALTGQTTLQRRPGQVRRRLLAAIVALPLFAAASLAVWKNYQNRPSGKIIVLVAYFDPDPEDPYHLTRSIVEDLRAATKEYSEVRIEPLRRFISWDRGDEVARTEGKIAKATIVLWGDYTKPSGSDTAMVTAHFQVLTMPSGMVLTKESEKLVVPASQLDHFTVQEQVSQQMSYLTLLVVGIIRSARRDFRGAVATFDNALRQPQPPGAFTNPAVPYYYRGTAYLFLGNVGESISDLRVAVGFKPDDCSAHLNLGGALLKGGDYNAAITEFKRAIELKPDFAGAHFDLGQALMQEGENGASAEFRKAIAVEAGFSIAQTYLAAALLQEHQFDEAILEGKKAVTLEPDNPRAHATLSAALAAKGRYDEAIPEGRKALALDPKLLAAHTSLGLALNGKHLYDEAVAECREAISLDPKSPELYSNLATALLGKGHYGEAIDAVKKSMELHFWSDYGRQPSTADMYSYLVSWGESLTKERQYGMAFAVLRKAIELQPESEAAYVSLSLALDGEGQYDAAISACRKAVALRPDSPQAHGALGVALMEKGQGSAAAAEMKAAFALQAKQAGRH